MRLRAVVGVCAAVALGAPAGAPAVTIQVPRLPGPSASPETVPIVVGAQPVGDGIVFASGSTTRGWTVWLAAPGSPPRALARIAAARSATSDVISVEVSPTRLVVAHHAETCDDASEGCKYMFYRLLLDSLVAGPIAGPLSPIAQCEGGQPCAASFPCMTGRPRFDAVLGGDLLAVIDRCSGGSAAVTNLATGASVPLGSAEAVAVAGPFVAVAVADPAAPAPLARIVVRSAASGAEVYRPGLPAITIVGEPEFALLRDGTVVYVASASGGVAVAVASAAGPAGRVLRYESGPIQIYGAGAAGVLASAPGSGLELVPLDGSQTTAPVLNIANAISRPAFDGQTVVWAQRLCVTTTITSWRPGEPAPPGLDLRCPTPAPSAAAATLSGDRRLGAVVSCPATTRGGCQAFVDLTAVRGARAGRGLAPTSRSRRLGGVDVALDPGTRGLAEVVVSRSAARWVRRYAPLRLRVDVQSSLYAADERPTGDSGRTSRTVALRAAR
jgi:hypothetical protein